MAYTRELIVAAKAIDGFREKVTHLETINAQLLEALKFYAKGEWSDGYPGGIKVREGEDIFLDFGEMARDAIKKAEK